MGMYIWRRCSKCGTLLRESGYHHVALGNPIVNCQKCNALIKLDHINEWELMSFGKRMYHLVASLKTALVLAVIVGFLISLIMKLIHQEIELVTLFIISPIVAFTFTIIMAIKNIYNSKERMKDPEYRKSFENLGLIKNKK